MGDSLELMQKV